MLWASLPLPIQLLILAFVGAASAALLNCVVFACSNVHRLTNPWAPVEQGQPPRSFADCVPIWGWIRLRRETKTRGKGFWIAPFVCELLAALGLPLWFLVTKEHGAVSTLLVEGWLKLSSEIHWSIVAAAGLFGGAIANYLIYTQAHQPRPISPWAPPDEQAPPRSVLDRIPIFGWVGLRRESELHGCGFWVRPLLLEVSVLAALLGLFWWETKAGGLFDLGWRSQAQLFAPYTVQVLFAHAALLVLLTAATFIDFDEKTIPDVITIPGTLLALTMASISVSIFMPTSLPVAGPIANWTMTTFESPWYEGNPKWMSRTGLNVGWLIWSVWCFALADRRFPAAMIRRRGWVGATEFFFAVLVRHWTWKLLAAMWLAGCLFIDVIWNLGGQHWVGLLTALIGLAVGGGTIWAVRIVGSWAANTEAMGFGDVTLMAMVGAFLGWQAALCSFFLAPFAAIVIVLIQFIVTRNPQIPFGPYLCAGAALTVVFWDKIYNQIFAPILVSQWELLQGLSIICLVLMGVMLFISRMIKTVLFYRGEHEEAE